MSVDHERLKEILAEAAALTMPEGRTAYLDDACGDDAELRAELESLLAAHEEAGEFLSHSVLPPAEDSNGEGPGTVVGRYKLLEEIGEGTFGRVFVAEQTKPVRRKVALKIVKAGMDTREVIARFEAERQALALMDHPNIAKIHDAGTTEAGRPFFVMELVKGLPITEYCDQGNLTMSGRLEIFLQVCQAVQHAHQKGVIHRDLKPTNILVTEIDGEPVPKIIDFGVAKALGQQLTEKTLYTAFQQIIGTPAYMSPEQTALSGTDVDTRSDVYSLGVLLYELLTGVTPIDNETLHRAGLEEVRRMIRETEPPKPSTRLHTLGAQLAVVARHRQTEPAALTRSVHGDLDWIVMRALEKDRGRRYPTINALAEDLHHHLAHEPVEAGPPGAFYRTRKFVRRHRVGVLLGSTVAAAVLVSLAAAIGGYVQVREHRNRAVSAEQQALVERDRAVTAEQAIEQERNQAEFLAARSALEAGQSALESGDRRGLLDLVEAHRLAERHPAHQRIVGRRWALWNAFWDQVTIAESPHAGTMDTSSIHIPSPDHLQYVSIKEHHYVNHEPEVRLYDTLTGELAAAPMMHESAAQGCAFSPDGSLLATMTARGVIHLWHRRTGKPARPPCETGDSALRALAFSPCGRYIVASPVNNTGPKTTRVALLRIGEPDQQAHLLEHQHPVNGARFSPDGELLAVPCKPELQLWRTADRERAGPPLPITTTPFAAFTADGTRLAFNLATPPGIGLLNTETMQLDRALSKGSGHAVFSHDGRLLASYHKGLHTVSFWRLDSPDEPYATGRLDERRWGDLTFSPDDSLLAAAVRNGTIRVLRTSDGHTVRKLYTNRLPSPTFLPNGVLAVVARDGIHFWDLEASPLPVNSLPHDALAHSLAFDRSGEFLAVGGRNELRLWRIKPSPRLDRVVPMPGRVVALAFPAEEGQFAAFSDDGSFTMVDQSTGEAKLRTHIGSSHNLSPPLGARLSHDARKLALFVGAYRNKRPMVVDLVDLQSTVSHRLEVPGKALSVDFRPDSQQLAVGTDTWNLLVYDTSTESPSRAKRLPASPDGWVEQLAYHPDGRLIAICVEGFVIRLYDSQTRPMVYANIQSSLAEVRHLCFSPDGHLLAAAGKRIDGGHGVELWHVDPQPSLHRAGELLSCKDALWCLAFSPDSRTLAAGGWGSTQIWHLPPTPDNHEAVLSQTSRTLGFRADDDQKRVYLELPKTEIEEIRKRISGQ